MQIIPFKLFMFFSFSFSFSFYTAVFSNSISNAQALLRIDFKKWITFFTACTVAESEYESTVYTVHEKRKLREIHYSILTHNHAS